MSLFDEIFPDSDSAWKDAFDGRGAGLCSGPTQAQEPAGIIERRYVQYEPETTGDQSPNLAPDVAFSDLVLTSSPDVDFDFDSNLDLGSQIPSSLTFDQPYTTCDLFLKDNVDQFPMPDGLANFNSPLPSRLPSSPSFISENLPSNASLSSSIFTQPTSPNLLSQAEIQPSSRLPLQSGRIAPYNCALCPSNFALHAQLT